MSDLLEPMSFDELELRKVPITIKGDKYILQEATGDVARRYRNFVILKANAVNKGQGSEKEGLGDAELLLLSHCLFSNTGTQEAPVVGPAVPRAVVAGWPARITKPLFDRAKKISGLEESGGVDELKKQREELDERIAELEGEDVALGK